jgi:hypothetical protein
MNGLNAQAKPSQVQIIAVISAGVISAMLAWALMWCAMWKIYIDVPLLMALSNILSGIGGAITTILVGRSISQLNQPDEPIPTQIKQPPGKPVPVEQVEPKP